MHMKATLTEALDATHDLVAKATEAPYGVVVDSGREHVAPNQSATWDIYVVDYEAMCKEMPRMEDDLPASIDNAFVILICNGSAIGFGVCDCARCVAAKADLKQSL